MKTSVFNAYSQYYDLIYRDKDYFSEVDYIENLLRRFHVKGNELLEFGAGTGKHGQLLAERGYRVTGIERSAEMVLKAPSSSGFTCMQGDICSVQVGRTFDAVISLFHVISYLTKNADVQAVFARAAEHLVPDGLFIFDVWYTPAVYIQKPEIRVKRMADKAIEITRIAEPVLHPNDNSVEVNYTIFSKDLVSGAIESISETHPMRHFSIPELDLLAQISGFNRIGVEEFLTGNAPSEKTWGVCFIFRKVV